MKKNKKKKESKKINLNYGLSPGSLIYIGTEHSEESSVHLLSYDERAVKTTLFEDVGSMVASLDPHKVNWINITGIHNTEIVGQIGKAFGVHSLVLEDILNTEQRPKVEVYDNYLFISLKFVSQDIIGTSNIEIQQISFILGPHYVISFQEIANDFFKPIRKRIDVEQSRIRSLKADYLLFTLVDLVSDHYLSLIDHIGNAIELLEDEIHEKPEEHHLHEVMINKRNLLHLIKIILPFRESMLQLKSIQSPFIDESNKIYFEDVRDHLSTAKESLELYFELNKSLRESYQSSISFKTNKVMQLLTIISTLFIPLTFIVGVYGMNFVNMPELSYRYGYFIVWGIMIIITVLLVFYFKRKKWL